MKTDKFMRLEQALVATVPLSEQKVILSRLRSLLTEIEATQACLNELVHANEDSIDNYHEITNACAKAKKQLPDYSENAKIFDDEGNRVK